MNGGHGRMLRVAGAIPSGGMTSAIALGYGGYAVTFAVSQLPARMTGSSFRRLAPPSGDWCRHVH